MFWGDDYLNSVASQIRVERARIPLMEELREHLECQREAYLAEGMEEAEARNRAIADMGDALLVGGELDRVHRPRIHWKGVLIALFLIVLGLSMQRMLLPVDMKWRIIGRQMIFPSIAAGLILLLAATDYTLWLRLTIPVFLVWWGLYVTRIGHAPRVIYFGLERYIFAFSPECLALAMPVLLAFAVCRLRSRGRGSLIGCAAMPAMIALLSLRYQFSGRGYDAMMLMSSAGFGLLYYAARHGFFRLKSEAAQWLSLLMTALTFAGFAWGFARQMRLNQPWMDEVVRPLLRGAKLLGTGAIAQGVGTLNYTFSSEDFLPLVIYRFGWLPFALLTGALAGLLAWSFARFIRMENRMGALLGMAATATLALQCILFYLASFTNYTQDLCLPLLSYGSIVLAIDAILVGVILSTLRSESLPEPKPSEHRIRCFQQK